MRSSLQRLCARATQDKINENWTSMACRLVASFDNPDVMCEIACVDGASNRKHR